MADTGEAPLRLWLFNQYALRIDQPGITRHSTLAKFMSEHGIRTSIFASPTHYWNVKPQEVLAADWRLPTFHYTKTAPVEHNGARRVLSMVSFAARSAAGPLLRPPKGDGPPDIVMGSSPQLFAAFGGWLVARRYGVPFIVEIRDLWPKSLIQLLGLGDKHPVVVLLSLLERFLYRHSEMVVTLLPGSEGHIRAVAGRPVDIMVLPNGSDLERIPAYRDKQRGADEDFVVMYAGAHGVPNSLETLLGAALELQQRGEHGVSFVLVGGGKEKANLQRFAEEHHLNHVSFQDPLPKDDLLRTLPTADALAISVRDSPLYADGISMNKLFDYFGAGRPVLIATNARNPVSESGAGVVTPPEDSTALADAIVRLRNEPVEQLQEMGRRGRRYVEENNNMAVSAARLASALRQTVNRGRRRHRTSTPQQVPTPR